MNNYHRLCIEKDLALFAIQEVINEYQGSEWFKEKKCKYVEQLKFMERIDVANTQTHFGFTYDKRKMWIVNRGSDEVKDWFGKTGNFNFSFITQKIETKVKVSAGFLSPWKAVKKNYIQVIDRYCPDVIYVCGHSRGSAFGAIAAENIAYMYPDINVKGIYFSSPMPGNQDFADLHDLRVPNSINIYVMGDPVVVTPPWICGYRSIRNQWSAFGGGYGFPPFINAHYPSLVQKIIKEKY